VHYETLAGENPTEAFDFARLIPAFAGVDLKAFDKMNADITGKLFDADKFMKMAANYEVKPFEAWVAADCPRNCQNPDFTNIDAVGIASALPHPISKPMENPNGTKIFPSPPRTGMPYGVYGSRLFHRSLGCAFRSVVF
jgi:sulfide:quinone oxidoreductase